MQGTEASLRILNFSPIHFDDQEIKVGRLPYGDDGAQVLRDLRDEHRGTHVIRREGSDSILAVPVVPDVEPIGKAEAIRLTGHLGLTAELIRNALLNSLAELGGTSRDYDPIEVVSRARRDLLRMSCPPEIEPPEWLAVRVLYEVAVRPIIFGKGKRLIAAMFNVRTTRVIDRTVADLIADGLCLTGTYVRRKVSRKDSRIEPRFETLGCVRSIEGSRLLLTDSRDGIDAVEASEVWPAKELFDDCLSHVFKGRAREIKDALECHRAALYQGPAQVDRIGRVLARLQSRKYELVPGVPFTFGPFLNDSTRNFPRLIPAPRPTYVFDGTGSKTHESRDDGLNAYGPYTNAVQAVGPPRICVICQKIHKARVEQFLRVFFFNGVKLRPSHREGKQPKNYFAKAFSEKYTLRIPAYEYFLADGPSAAAYYGACQEALVAHGNGQPWDLALIQIEEAFRNLPLAHNPYLVAKASFQGLQVAVQEFKIETAQKWGAPLSYCLNQMSLATYAKLGGVPCLMKTKSIGAHEIAVGLGSAEVGEGRFGQRERFVGITTIFSSDGNYHLYNLSRAVSADKYQSAMLNALRAALESIRTGMNWQPGDQVRLVFHAKFKRFGKNEVQAVKDLINELGEYDVQYALLHVNEQHPYMLFDTSQDGVRDFETGAVKGQYAPKRGRYLPLGDRDVLLCLAGPYEVKRPENGTPRPLLLSLHPDSTLTDMPYLTHQVFAFACNSLRTFLPISLPVTIQYPNLIADLLGKLSYVEGWSPDALLDKLGKKPWFL